jgi:peroxin-6
MPISLQTSPFGSGQPAIPTARTVTLARVASPLSTDRTYQPLFLRSLKVYFDGMKRLVKQGDVIAVGIDTDALLRIRGSDSEVGDTGDAVDQDGLDHK